MLGDHKSFDDGTLAQAVAECRVGTSYELKGVLGPEHPRPMHEQNNLQRHGITTAYQKSTRHPGAAWRRMATNDRSATAGSAKRAGVQ